MALMAPKSRYLRKMKGGRCAAGRPSSRPVLACGIGAAVHDAGLDPGVALPFAALRDEIVFQRVERADQRPGVAVRPQAHVDAEDLAVGGDVAERLDDALAEAVEEVEILDALLRPRRIAVLRVDEDVIDIGRDVQLRPPSLPMPTTIRRCGRPCLSSGSP